MERPSNTYPTCFLLLAVLGSISLLRRSIALLKWIYVAFLRPSKKLRDHYGSWALITGATDGIGKAFAFALADEGLNLVLVGRNRDKLFAVRKEIESRAGHVLINAVVVDLSEDAGRWIRRIEEAVAGVEVGVLVNNAGTTYPHAAYFHEAEEALLGEVVRVNVEGTTSVTKVVMRGMAERRRGAVVSIGSAASVVVPSFPLHAVYASTKGYVNRLRSSAI